MSRREDLVALRERVKGAAGDTAFAAAHREIDEVIRALSSHIEAMRDE